MFIDLERNINGKHQSAAPPTSTPAQAKARAKKISYHWNLMFCWSRDLSSKGKDASTSRHSTNSIKLRSILPPNHGSSNLCVDWVGSWNADGSDWLHQGDTGLLLQWGPWDWMSGARIYWQVSVPSHPMIQVSNKTTMSCFFSHFFLFTVCVQCKSTP